jgi:hypothetical protein
MLYIIIEVKRVGCLVYYFLWIALPVPFIQFIPRYIEGSAVEWLIWFLWFVLSPLKLETYFCLSF